MKQILHSLLKTFFLAAGTFLFLFGFAACSIDPVLVTRPSGSEPYKASTKKLETLGAKLWKDPSLSAAGDTSCNTCHNGAALEHGASIESFQINPSFTKPYPHRVEMVESMSGLKSITAEQMVQFCMLAPMGQKKPLPWDSEKLAALTAYTLKLNRIAQKQAKK